MGCRGRDGRSGAAGVTIGECDTRSARRSEGVSRVRRKQWCTCSGLGTRNGQRAGSYSLQAPEGQGGQCAAPAV